jgi:hypothetical protein
VTTAYVLWFFLGILGVHRFYLGRTWSGVLFLFSLGIFGIGWIVDAFLIPQMVEEENLLGDEPYGQITGYVPSPTPIVVQPRKSFYTEE